MAAQPPRRLGVNAALWFVLGAFSGFDVALAYAWLSARRASRGRELRWRVASYTSRTARPW